MRTVAYYVTAHGYGHGTRSCDVLNALRSMDPTARLIVTTDLPLEFMRGRLAPGIEIRGGAFDVGLVQKDSIQVDLEASIDAIERLYSREEELIERERRFLAEEEVGVVVADIPAIPLEAARRNGITNIASGNFGWDWIYEEFAETDERWAPYVEKFRGVYERTDLLLRQPFAEPMSAFPERIELPVLASPGTARRRLLAESTGADPDKDWVLLSFTSIDLNEDAIARIGALKQYEFFTVEPLVWAGSKIHAISRSLVSFADALASCDFAVTKPGFGIVSECVVNDKPIIYSDRANFKEYPVLVDSIETHCRHAFIPNAELYAGDLARALDEARRAPAAREPIGRGGAEIEAQEILARAATPTR